MADDPRPRLAIVLRLSDESRHSTSVIDVAMSIDRSVDTIRSKPAHHRNRLVLIEEGAGINQHQALISPNRDNIREPSKKHHACGDFLELASRGQRMMSSYANLTTPKSFCLIANAAHGFHRPVDLGTIGTKLRHWILNCTGDGFKESVNKQTELEAMTTVRLEVEDSIAIVTINRPEMRNAVNRETADALADVFRHFNNQDSLRVAILTGAGGCFCAGADLKAAAGGKGNRVEPDGDGPLGCTRMVLGKPVIAAVEGFAVAGGLELAVWCDMRVAARDAVFGVFCRRFGVPLIDGGTVRLPRLIGMSHALDLILTGRGVSGDEALGMGLVNRLVEPAHALEEACGLARQLVAFPQLCMRSDRSSAYEGWTMPLEEALANEFRHGLGTIQSGETRIGAQRFKSGAGRHGQF
jgi:enoyl-CoA hydratase